MSKRAVPSELEAHLGYWLRLVSNEVSQGFARALEADGVSVADWVALRLLFDRDRQPSDLAAAMGFTRGAVTKLIDRLETRDLVRRESGTGRDGRAQSLTLTPSGRAVVPRLAALADANDAAFFGDMDAQERAVLRRVLVELARRHGLSARIPTE